jgi:hypothetical protein
MSNFKIASRDNNYIIECVHCNGTGFCKNYVSLYKTEIKTLDNSCIWLEFVFNFFTFL